MRNAGLEELEAGIKISGRDINNLRYADDTTLMAESKEELKTFLMRVKEVSERASLKLNTKKTKIMASSPITSWQIEGEKVELVTDFLFLSSKIAADGDISHEIRRHLLLGRKTVTNLDSVLKSRDITLLTNVYIVKAMVFPVVMYGCESWTIKKAECQKPVNLKENQPRILLEGLMLKLKLQYFGYLMQTSDSLEKSLMLGKMEGRKRRWHQKVRWLDGITDARDMNLDKLWEMVRHRVAWHAAVCGVTKSCT